MDKLKLIKAMVFVMTFLLVFGSLVMLGTLFQKSRGADAPAFPDTVLNEPAGSSIKDVTPSENHLFITVSEGGKSDRIIIFDLTSGQKKSVISVN